MKKRSLGAELELFLTKNGQPATPTDWIVIVDRAIKKGYKVITDPYSGFKLGAAGHHGWFVLDNNCAIVELVSIPFDSIDDVINNLKSLLDFFKSIAPEYQVHWTSQWDTPSEDEYWKRSVPTGLYAIVRNQKWEHWRLMNSMAFQPAIDVDADEAATVLRVLNLCAPLFVYLYGGRENQICQNTSRLEQWQQAVPHSHLRTGIPKNEIRSLRDYIDNLLDLPAFAVSDQLGDKKMRFFEPMDQSPLVRDVIGQPSPARRLLEVPNLSQISEKWIETDSVKYTVRACDLYALSLPFWHIRLVYKINECNFIKNTTNAIFTIENATKLYIELRHIGTPIDFNEMAAIYRNVLNIVERAEEIDLVLSPLMSWQEAQQENEKAVRFGIIGEKSAQAYSKLQDLGIFPQEKIL